MVDITYLAMNIHASTPHGTSATATRTTIPPAGTDKTSNRPARRTTTGAPPDTILSDPPPTCHEPVRSNPSHTCIAVFLLSDHRDMGATLGSTK